MSKLQLLLLLFLVAGLASSGVTAAFGWGSAPAAPSESECRPYIEKALKELSADTTAPEAVDTTSEPETSQTTDTSKEDSKEDSKEEGAIESKDDTITIETQEKDEGSKSEEDTGKESGESTDAEKSKEGEDVSAEAVSAGEEKSEEDKAAEDTSAETQEDKSGETEEVKSGETEEEKSGEADEAKSGEVEEAKSGETEDGKSGETEEAKSVEEGASAEEEGKSEETAEDKSAETEEKSGEDKSGEKEEKSAEEDEGTSAEADVGKEEESKEESGEHEEVKRSAEDTAEESGEKKSSDEKPEAEAASKEDVTEEQADEKSSEADDKSTEAKEESAEEETTSKEESKEDTDAGSTETTSSEEQASAETTASEEKSPEGEDKSAEGIQETQGDASKESKETADESGEASTKEESGETAEEDKSEEKDEGKAEESEEGTSKEEKVESEEAGESEDKATEEASEEEKKDEESKEEAEGKESEEAAAPEEELTMEIYIPEKLRSRDHIAKILKLDEESAEPEKLLSRTIDITLRDLKRIYDTAIKPLEVLYKYRDLSNRHFGDPEIFSKPLVLFMGPWSGGKSTIINYLLDIEYKKTALRTGAEPSPAYFNILMYGEEEEVLDGTQLAADWTFSGLQKFGQGLLDRLRGLKLSHPLLEKVNIVEIPGILEIRKQVERLFPFNDACQWFIDRADIIFLVYDPSKLDVGPETEAILDQLKGREYQSRIILNKADQVKPEELMRVQGTLIWNISPLMSSSEPPIMYSTSLWSLPYETGAPTRLLKAQEQAFLQDLRSAVDKRVENKIASARRFAVRVRNHAKMVDCYLTTYYNHKSFFGNRKKVADDITEHPQNYHIYEGLSTLTNISRYDLPDPEVYRDFFRLNPLYDFQQLSATCTYFRGCPINRLDVAIAYELPELVGKYKKAAEAVLASEAGTETTKS